MQRSTILAAVCLVLTALFVSPATAQQYQSTFISQSVPTSMVTGQQYSVSVTMKNTGTDTWTSAAGYNLGSQNPQDNLTWGIGRVPVPASVSPGQQVTFNFTVTAPSTAATYNFQWKMLQEGVTWFGAQTSNVPVQVQSGSTPHQSQFVSQTVPTTMTAAQNYSVSITMKNTGSETWTSAAGYKLGSQNPQDNVTWNTSRVPLPASVSPGQQVTFNFTVTAPATPATYNFQWKMLQEGVVWFGAQTSNVQVQVSLHSAQSPGGTNLVVWKADITSDRLGNPTACVWEPYGVIPNYNQTGVRSTVQSQLAAMYAAGQRRLSIPVFVGYGTSSGLVMDVTSGDLSPQQKANLTQVIADAKAQGFGEFVIKMVPIGALSPVGLAAANYDPTMYAAYRSTVFSVRNLVATAGILYWMDLLGEGMPPTSGGQPVYFPGWSKFVRQLWTDYTVAFGKADTLGYSVAEAPSDLANRIDGFTYVYQGNYPYLFSVHIYDNATSLFTQTHNLLNQYGFTTTGLIIGETYFNNATEAAAFYTAIAQTGRTVFYLLQWPVTPAGFASSDPYCQQISISNWTPYSNYQQYGF